MKSQEHFNSQYESIDIIHVPLYFSINNREIRKRLVEEIKKSKKVADLGCGHGGTLVQFSRINPEAKIIGVDYSEVALKKVKKIILGYPGIETCLADLTKERLSEKFDCIYTSQVIEHVQEDDLFIKNAYESLIPGGAFVVATVLKKKYARYFYRNEKGEAVLEPTHVREYKSIKELTDKIEKQGFTVEAVGLNIFRFPLIDPILKVLTRYFKNQFVFSLVNHPVTMVLRFLTGLPIPGYYNLQVFCRKPVIVKEARNELDT